MRLAALLVLVGFAACGTTAEPLPPHNTTPAPRRTFESKLKGAKRERFDRYATSIASPCGRAHSLLTSLASDPSCTRTPHALRYLERLVGAEVPDDQLHMLYDGRYATAPIHKIDVSHAPLVGSRHASVQCVVFEDLQCPHCAALAPIIEGIETKYADRIAVFYKHYPLAKPHPRAREAAIAAVAADHQGKFIQMTETIFADQSHVSTADLESDARQLGLDIPTYLADITNPETAAIVDGDIAEAEALGLDYVPGIFIDGRQYKGVVDAAELADVIEEALEAAER